MALTILKKAFANAALDNRETVEIKDIAEAINICDRLYPNVRERVAKELMVTFKKKEENNGKGIVYSKVIPFPKKQSKYNQV